MIHTSKEAVEQGSQKRLKTTLIGIIISALLALVKAMGGILGNSYALIADAIEENTASFGSAHPCRASYYIKLRPVTFLFDRAFAASIY